MAQSEVHAYPVDLDGPTPTILRAPCGHQLTVADAEQVTRFVGAPCMACLLVAFGVADRAADAAAPPPELPEGIMARLSGVLDAGDIWEPVTALNYAAAMRGERLTHFAEPDAVHSSLDGRSVVQTLCRHLAWGPLAAAVPGWPMCGECTELALAAASA
ncbi:hypothetical protein [Saccharopolyspora hattusasensis]|uniref:hypothetical protein n=1 Tax=Saccharopolyspora hattusasensis TaxID=1128679 RepID=UPI003D96B09B